MGVNISIHNPRDADDTGAEDSMALDFLEGDAQNVNENNQTAGGGDETSPGQAYQQDTQSGSTDEGSGDDQDEGATSGAEQDRRVPLAALKDERKKRQQAEQSIRSLEQRLAYIEGQQASLAKPKEEEFVWDEEKVLGDLPGALQTVEERVYERVRKERYEESTEIAEAMFDDFNEVMAHINDAAKADPSLGQAISSSKQPAILAYRRTKSFLEQKKSPRMTQEQIDAEVEKRLNARLEQMKKEQQSDGLPSNLSSARGSGAATARNQQWGGPTPLDTLFDGR